MGSGLHSRIRLTRTPRSGHVGDARGWGRRFGRAVTSALSGAVCKARWLAWPGHAFPPAEQNGAQAGCIQPPLPRALLAPRTVRTRTRCQVSAAGNHTPAPSQPRPHRQSWKEDGGLQLLGVGQAAAFGRGGASVLCPAAAGSLPARLPGTPTARGALAEQSAILGATVALCRSGDEGTRAAPIRHPAPQPREGLNIWRPSCAERPRAGVWFPPDRDSSLPHTSHLGARRGLSPSLEEPTVRS